MYEKLKFIVDLFGHFDISQKQLQNVLNLLPETLVFYFFVNLDEFLSTHSLFNEHQIYVVVGKNLQQTQTLNQVVEGLLFGQK